MLALAMLSDMRNVPFTYFTPTVPDRVKQHMHVGNFAKAKSLGMHPIEVTKAEYQSLSQSLAHWVETHHPTVATTRVCIPQGVHCSLAEPGVAQLAREIQEFQHEHQLPRLRVVLPSGTGTTALYLAKHLDPQCCQVWTVACVGSIAYLRAQMEQLSPPPHRCHRT